MVCEQNDVANKDVDNRDWLALRKHKHVDDSWGQTKPEGDKKSEDNLSADSMGAQEKSERLLDQIDAEMFAASGWNEALGEYGDLEPSKRARTVDNFQTFVHEMVYGNHMDDVVVFRDGIRKAGLSDSIPEYLRQPLMSQSTIRDLLENIDEPFLDRMDGHVYCFDDGHEDEPLRKQLDGSYTNGLLEKRNVMRQRSEQNFYITELQLRKEHKYRHPLDNQYTRTLLKRSVKDIIGKELRDMLVYWDRYNEGGFLGGKMMGSPLHIDQCLWSNVGRNWAGYKVMALWRLEDDELIENHRRQLFSPPLSKKEMKAMRSAVKVCIVRPGDLFFFSGANPHMVMCVSDDLSYTSYESFINNNPKHLETFCKSNTSEHNDHFHMRDSTLEDIKFEIVDQVNDQMEWIEDNKIHGEDAQLILAACRLLRSKDRLMHDEIYSPRKAIKVLESSGVRCPSPLAHKIPDKIPDRVPDTAANKAANKAANDADETSSSKSCISSQSSSSSTVQPDSSTISESSSSSSTMRPVSESESSSLSSAMSPVSEVSESSSSSTTSEKGDSA